MSERRVSEQGVTPIRRAEGQLWLRRQIRFERFALKFGEKNIPNPNTQSRLVIPTGKPNLKCLVSYRRDTEISQRSQRWWLK